ncbi:hypothetical protein PRUPE_1G015000 [Prunus persica]|uniref:Uncharacterized protein n=1 Tax=Prunus persica TaxID=3760 RepID=A0A251QRA3_PRUPE|nr:hypothetical protein PRUPE_1G015000 [Prunus persica]
MMVLMDEIMRMNSHLPLPHLVYKGQNEFFFVFGFCSPIIYLCSLILMPRLVHCVSGVLYVFCFVCSIYKEEMKKLDGRRKVRQEEC